MEETPMTALSTAINAPVHNVFCSCHLCQEWIADQVEKITPVRSFWQHAPVPNCTICGGNNVSPNTVNAKEEPTSWLCADCVMWFDAQKGKGA
jgi:hypothetical protein